MVLEYCTERRNVDNILYLSSTSQKIVYKTKNKLNPISNRLYLSYDVNFRDYSSIFSRFLVFNCTNKVGTDCVNIRIDWRIDAVIKLCKQILSFLSLDKDGIAIIEGRNNVQMSFVISCFLRYLNLFGSCYESLEFVLHRSFLDRSFLNTNTTLKRYLRYFNDLIISKGLPPNIKRLFLRKIIISSPNVPSSSYYEIETYSSKKTIKGYPLAMDSHNSLFIIEANHPSFSGDFTIKIYKENHSLLLSLTLNTGFISEGLLRLWAEDLDEVGLCCSNEKSPVNNGYNLLERFSSILLTPLKKHQMTLEEAILSIDLYFENDDGDDHHSSSDCNGALKYDFQYDLEKSLQSLVESHSNIIDDSLLDILLKQGYMLTWSSLVLKLFNNDIHDSHVFLDMLDKDGFDVCNRSHTIMNGVSEDNHIIAKPNVNDKIDITKGMDNLLKVQNIVEPKSNLQNIMNPKASVQNIMKPKPCVPLPKSVIPPPPPQPLKKGIIPPPPPPPPPSNTKIPPPPPGIAQKTLKRSKSKLHWQELRLKSGTIWSSPSMEELEPLEDEDYSTYEELFCSSSAALEKLTTQTSVSTAAQTTTATTTTTSTISKSISLKRIQNISIGLGSLLKYLPSEKNNEQSIVSRLMNRRNLLKIPMDQLEMIPKLLPTEEEREALLPFKDAPPPPSCTSVSELFLIESSKTPALPFIVRAVIFEVHFEKDVCVLEEKIVKITRCCHGIHASTLLPELFGIILQVGNMVNGESGMVGAFKINSLALLEGMKSRDKSCNLLDFIIQVIKKRNPSILLARDEFPDISLFKEVDSIGMELTSIERALKDIQKRGDFDEFAIEQMEFITSCNDRIEKSLSLYREMDQDYRDVKRYLGGGTATDDPDLFMILDSFLLKLQKEQPRFQQ